MAYLGIHPLFLISTKALISILATHSKHWEKRNLLIAFHLILTNIIEFHYLIERASSGRNVIYAAISSGQWFKGHFVLPMKTIVLSANLQQESDWIMLTLGKKSKNISVQTVIQ